MSFAKHEWYFFLPWSIGQKGHSCQSFDPLHDQVDHNVATGYSKGFFAKQNEDLKYQPQNFSCTQMRGYQILKNTCKKCVYFLWRTYLDFFLLHLSQLYLLRTNESKLVYYAKIQVFKVLTCHVKKKFDHIFHLIWKRNDQMRGKNKNQILVTDFILQEKENKKINGSFVKPICGQISFSKWP